MFARQTIWLSAVFALTFGSGAAQAGQMDDFEGACSASQESYAAHIEKVTNLGWQRNDAHPALAALMTGIASNSLVKEVQGFTRDGGAYPYVLTLSRGSGLTICTVLDPNATAAVDAAAFKRRFDPIAMDPKRLLNNLNAVFYADASAPPEPRYAILGDRRPKVERGLVGQRMTSSYFTQGSGG